MFHVTVDLSEFRSAATKTRNALVRAAYDGARVAAEAGRDEAKSAGSYQDQSGELRSTIHARHAELTARGGTWEVVAPKPYALFVEGGTVPHVIEARRKPFLQFYWAKQGRWFKGRRVNHPGTRPYPFMGPGYEKAERVLRAELEASVSRIAQGWS